jgi:hypothetical protein
MNILHQDWKMISELVLSHSIEAASQILKWEVIGIAVSIALIFVFWKRNLLKRPANKYYNWAVKLYIPMILVVGFIFFGKIGIIKFAHKTLTKENEAAVDMIYKNSLGKVLGSADDEKSLIRYAEKIGTTVKTVEEGMDNLVYYITFNSDSTSNFVEKTVAAQMAGYFWKTKGKEMVYSGVYYLLAMALEKAHLPGDVEEKFTYENFKLGIEKLKDLDAKEFEDGMKKTIGSKTQHYIDSKMNTMFYMTLLTWLIIVLIPVIEYWAYKKFFEKKLLAQTNPKDNMIQ